MLKKYFVLISKEHWGVFLISDSSYPIEMLNNMEFVKSVSEEELNRYLIDNLGVNILINKEFDLIYHIGHLFSRKPS